MKWDQDQRLRLALKLCTFCARHRLRRGRYPLELSAQDEEGTVLRAVNHRLCQDHLEDLIGWLGEVPHTGQATMMSGRVFEWAKK